MKSRPAVQVEYGGPLEIEEIDIPDPGPNQVVVRNFASGVCYSERFARDFVAAWDKVMNLDRFDLT